MKVILGDFCYFDSLPHEWCGIGSSGLELQDWSSSPTQIGFVLNEESAVGERKEAGFAFHAGEQHIPPLATLMTSLLAPYVIRQSLCGCDQSSTVEARHGETRGIIMRVSRELLFAMRAAL